MPAGEVFAQRTLPEPRRRPGVERDEKTAAREDLVAKPPVRRTEIDDIDVVGAEGPGHLDVEVSQPSEGERASAQDGHIDVADAFASLVQDGAEQIGADEIASSGQDAPGRLDSLENGVPQEHQGPYTASVARVGLRASRRAIVRAVDLADSILAGDPLAVSKGISLLENGDPEGRALLDRLAPQIGRAVRIGFTGPPGVGKSTLVDELTSLLRARGDKVGIIAVDPTSPFTGGALLGDRIRMAKMAETEDVFMRSMATRGSAGGLARATHDAADLLDASGRTFVLIETVGVGQSEIEISRGTDCVLVILSPESGDGIQAMKSGILEIADVLVINKADRVGADKLEYELRSAFEMGLRTRAEVPILLTEAVRGKGVPELLAKIDAFLAARRADGRLDERRRHNLEDRLKRIVELMIQRNLWEANGGKLSQFASDVLRRRRPMYQAAEQLMKEALP